MCLTALLIVCVTPAHAAVGSFVLTLEDVSRGTSAIITDQIAPAPAVPGDSNPAVDRIGFAGTVGTFDVVIVAITYLPGLAGAPVQVAIPTFRATSVTPGLFRVTLWRTDVTSPLLGSSVVGAGTAGAALTAGGDVTFKSWIDGGPPVFDPASNTIYAGSLSGTSGPVRLNGSFDLLNVIELNFNSGGTMEARTDLQVLNKAEASGHNIVVGDGTAASCTDAAMLAALDTARTLEGGTIRFRCGPDPVTIALEGGFDVPITVPNDTTINGEGLVTIDVGYQKIQIDPGTSVRLVSLGLQFARIDNWGELRIDASVFSHGLMSGILNYGTLIVKDTTFSDMGPFRWPIQNEGTATLNRVRFLQNYGTVFNNGTLAVKHSTWFDNFIDVTGGIVNAGTLTLDDSEFAENGGLDAGALLNTGSLAITNSIFRNNVGSQSAPGAIRNFGNSSLSTIVNSKFVGNSGFYGGAIDHRQGSLSIRGTTFTGNTGFYGGAIITSAPLLIANSTITGNTALGNGGGIYVDGVDPTLKNTEVSGNTPDDIFVRPATSE